MQEQVSVDPAIQQWSDHGREWFTTAEVAARYRREPSTIRYWRHIGYGPRATSNGRIALYPRAEIEKYDRELLASVGAKSA